MALGRRPVRWVCDTAGAHILPTTLNNDTCCAVQGAVGGEDAEDGEDDDDENFDDEQMFRLDKAVAAMLRAKQVRASFTLWVVPHSDV
jgi:hypothetical protein